MKKSVFAVITIAICAFTSCQNKVRTNSEGALKTDILLPTTPVKGSCTGSPTWAYAMLATIETEHLAKGDSVNLSAAYPLRMLLLENAEKSYFTSGTTAPSTQGMGPMAIHLIEKYGTVPYDSYPDAQHLNYNVVCQDLEKTASQCAGRHTGLDHFRQSAAACLDRYMGFLPGEDVFLLGAEYTKQEFARSVCAPDEYIWLTSFTHHPYYTRFALETPNNAMNDRFYNLPIDRLVQSIEKALRHGHPVCWEGDITNTSFKAGDPIAGRQLSPKSCTPQRRQTQFEQLFTTDDRAYELIGIAHDSAHREYFIAHDPQSPSAKAKPIYLSREYLYLYTIAVTMSKAAYGI